MISKEYLAQLADKAAQAIYDDPSLHAKELEVAVGLRKPGDERSPADVDPIKWPKNSTGDALYRHMKGDARFVKKQGGKATWDLAPGARASITKARKS